MGYDVARGRPTAAACSRDGRACAGKVPHGCATAGWCWTSKAAPFGPLPCQLKAGAAPGSSGLVVTVAGTFICMGPCRIKQDDV